MDETNKAALDRAITFLREGNLKEAQQILTGLALEDPQNPQIWFLLGYALPQQDKKIYAFKQVLKLHPGHEKAQQMLEKLEGKPPAAAPAPAVTPAPPPVIEPEPQVPAFSQPPPPIPVVQPEPLPPAPAAPSLQPPPLDDTSDPKPAKPEKKSRKFNPAIMIVSSIVLAITIIGVDFVFTGGLDKFLGIAQVPTETPAVALIASEEPTPGGIPTMVPTWTQTVTPTAAATFTISPTPENTNTPMPLPLPAQTRADMEAIQQQVSDLRQLSPADEVFNEIMPKLKLKLLMQEIFITEEFIASLEDEQIIMKALGFMEKDYDLVDAALNSRSDSIGGFYEPDTNWIHVIGVGFDATEQWIYAHEYAHALQDQHFDLTSLGVYPYCEKPIQACLATRALVEGEAEVVQEMWLTTYPPGSSIYSDNDFGSYSPLFQGKPLPPYYGLNMQFPYYFGQKFVSYLYENGGWDSVNRAYQSLPSTTEQIMHPEYYLSRHGALPLDSPAIGRVLGLNWRLVRRDSLGEWETFLLLGYPANKSAQRPDPEAYAAAAGWGGDSYQVYYNDDEKKTVLAVHWTWDTSSDAAQFHHSLKLSLNGRFQNATVDGPGQGQCWFYKGQFSCLYTVGMDVLWLVAPDIETMESLKTVFPQFP